MVAENRAGGSPLDFLIERRELLLSEPVDGWEEKTVCVNRCAKVVKGGRRFSFSVLVVAGNKAGLIGYGMGKAKEVTDAVRKASENAKKHAYKVSLLNNTIPHVALGVSDGGRVILKPACHGTGVIAGGCVRAVLEVAGVKDVLSKSLGSKMGLVWFVQPSKLFRECVLNGKCLRFVRLNRRRLFKKREGRQNEIG